MNARRALVPIACLLAGFLVGAFVFPGPYAYGDRNGAQYRVNRLTGVQEYSSSRGWVSEREMVRETMGNAFEGMGEAFRGMGRTTNSQHP